MKKLIAFSMIVVLSGTLVITGAFAGGAGDKSTQPVVLKLSHSQAEDLVIHKVSVSFANAVKERTNGAVKIDVYSSSQLGGERDNVEGLQLGTVDIAYVATAVIANFVPNYYLFDAPFLFADTDSAMAVCDSEIGKGLGQELHNKLKIRLLGFMDVGGRNIFGTKPVRTISDLRGTKIRTMENNLHMAVFNMLGAQATPMGWNEVFTALQQGTIDAAEQALFGITGNRFYEICKYIAISNHIYGVNVFIMGDPAYNKIPPQYRDIVMEEAWKCVVLERKMAREANEEALGILKANGCEISTLNHDELVSRVSPVYTQFASTLPLDLIAKTQALLASRR